VQQQLQQALVAQYSTDEHAVKLKEVRMHMFSHKPIPMHVCACTYTCCATAQHSIDRCVCVCVCVKGQFWLGMQPHVHTYACTMHNVLCITDREYGEHTHVHVYLHKSCMPHAHERHARE
jgi:hypothetical protein